MLNQYQLGIVNGLSLMTHLIGLILFVYVVYTLITSLENQSAFLWYMFVIYVVMVFSSAILSQIKTNTEIQKLKELINKQKWSNKYGV